jgi:hypothetical protein
MPFDVWLSRCRSAEAFADRESSKHETFSRSDYLALMARAPAVEQPDGVFRVRRNTGEPWLTARFVPRREGSDAGDIALGSSFSSPSFVRNWLDSFDLALTLAGSLRCKVYEDFRQQEVTSGNVDALLDPRSDYVRFHRDISQATLEELNDLGGVPLEYALGGVVDKTTVPFCFHVEGARPFRVDAVRLPVSLRMVRHGHDAAMVYEGELPLCRLLVRPDGKLQVWAAYGVAPFAQWANAALRIATDASSGGAGTVSLVGYGGWEGALRAEVEPLLAGLGCDFVAWGLRRAESP